MPMTSSYFSSRVFLASAALLFVAVVFLIPSATQAAFAGPALYTAGDGPLAVESADMDHDGDKDLLYLNFNDYTLHTRFGNGDGTFAVPVVRVLLHAPSQIRIADVDGDSDLDALIQNAASSSVSILLNNGSGTFGIAADYAVNGIPKDVHFRDVDLDGDIDIVTLNTNSHSVSILLNNGNGTFVAGTAYAVGSFPFSGPQIADLNGDNYPDLVVPSDSTKNVSVLLNNGNGTYASSTNYFTAATSTDEAFLADFDGDEDIDIAAGGYSNTGRLVIFSNNGNGTFVTSTTYEAIPNINGIKAGDLNDDGNMDLVLNGHLSGAQPNRIVIMLGNVDGTFAASTTYALSGYPAEDMYVEDIDGDSDLDVTIGMFSVSFGVAVLTNDGTGVFSKTEYTTAGAIGNRVLTISDFDGDGDKDMAAMHFSADNMSVFLNDTALPAPSLSTMNPSSAVAGSSGFTMTVTGSGFVTSTQVYFNGSSRSTTVVSPTQVTASILTGDLATAGSYPVVVYNSSFIGGGTSTADTFTVHAASGGAGSGGGGLSSSGSGGSSALPPLVTTFQTNLQNLQNQGVSVHGLIKIPSNSAVYYVGADGKRHAFPNDKVYFSWYENFDGVQLVNEAQLSSIPLGKNVTYKPGKKMVKFTTDNKVYVVAKGGILRWITTEEAAIALYGSSWNMQIDDISDAFYTNYTFGQDVSGLSDFNPTSVQASVQFPSDSLEM